MSNTKIFNLPLNGTSFGAVSISIAKELYDRKYEDILINNIGSPSLDSFDLLRSDEPFINWLNQKGGSFLDKYSRDFPAFKLWHINGSDGAVSKVQNLFTFHETDTITPTEKNILNNQDTIMVSCEYTKDVMESCGVTSKIVKIPLAFDSLHFKTTDDRKKISPTVCSFLVAGKFEQSRKRHVKTIQAWIKKFGGNPKFLLNLAIYNPFLSPEDNNKVMLMILNGQPKPFNVNIHPFYATLTEYNQLLNFTDVVIVMGNEAWDLPAFSAACLGKHVVAHNCGGIKEWANEDNATLIESTEKFPCYDNLFFKEGQPFSQGNFFDYSEDDLINGIEVAYKKWESSPINKEGLKLAEQFTWAKTVDKILEVF